MTNIPALDDFLVKIRSAGFFTRLFSWKRIMAESYAAEQKVSAALSAAEARAEFTEVTSKATLDAARERYESAQKDLKLQLEEIKNQAARNAEEAVEVREMLAKESALLKAEREKYTELKTEANAKEKELTLATERIAAEESVKEERTAEYERRVEALNTLTAELKENNERNEAQRRKELEARNAELETTWQRHEKEVEDTLRGIAKRYGFNRCNKEEYPYSGAPDNVFLIGGLYTIFDAKSPKKPDDLANFPIYLKTQAEGMKKYCKNENVRKDVFLVIPRSAAECIDTFIYPLTDYTVYVITPEAMGPSLQMLKTLETYDFTEQLSPEDRDKLVRYIAKLTHTTKRKIQIDTFLSQELISVLREASTLPEDFTQKIKEKEQTAKLNPPMEKRAKLIAVEDVAADVDQVERDILGWSRVEE